MFFQNPRASIMVNTIFAVLIITVSARRDLLSSPSKNIISADYAEINSTISPSKSTNSSTNVQQSQYTYSVNVIQESSSPILSFINHTSLYQQVFNPSWIPQSDKLHQNGLIVQATNCTLQPGKCSHCNSTASLLFTQCDSQSGHCDDIKPYTQTMHQAQGTYTYDQNPSIFYWNDLYYLFANTPSSSAQMYTSDNPTNMSWNLKMNAFQMNISGPVSLLPNNAKHYLFFGGNGHISITNSNSIEKWENINYSPWLSPRKDCFDAHGVETGPPPVILRDGNWLMLYNSFKTNQTSQTRQYEIGWVILSADNVSKIF